jgi:hypothetical protein
MSAESDSNTLGTGGLDENKEHDVSIIDRKQAQAVMIRVAFFMTLFF